MLKYIVILLLFMAAIGFSNSKNKTVKTVGLGVSILALIIYVYIEFGSVIVFNPIFIILYIAILFGVFLVIYKKYRNLKYQKESYEDINYLNRDISTEYPPSIVGYIIRTLINEKQNVKFDFSSWKRLVLEEYKIRKFAKEKMMISLKKLF